VISHGGRGLCLTQCSQLHTRSKGGWAIAGLLTCGACTLRNGTQELCHDRLVVWQLLVALQHARSSKTAYNLKCSSLDTVVSRWWCHAIISGATAHRSWLTGKELMSITWYRLLSLPAAAPADSATSTSAGRSRASQSVLSH
jgi:hypothetical protein